LAPVLSGNRRFFKVSDTSETVILIPLFQNQWVFEVFEIHQWFCPPFFFFGKPRADGSLILQYKQEPVVIIKLKYVPNTGQLDGWWMDGKKHFPFGFKFPSQP
jgi:hypothetical protein